LVLTCSALAGLPNLALANERIRANLGKIQVDSRRRIG